MEQGRETGEGGSMSRGRPINVHNSRACRRILAALEAGPLTAEQISAAASVGINTLTKGGYLRHMELAAMIHVAGWKPPARSGMWTPVWKLGAGFSAPMPPAQTNTEYARRWRHKVGNARAAQRRDIVRMDATPAPTYALPAPIRNWLAGVPA